MSSNGGLHIPMEDLILETEMRRAKEEQCTSYHCPCTKCHGGCYYSLDAIREHLLVNKRNPFLMHSMVGGDLERGYLEVSIWINLAGETIPSGNVFDDERIRTKYVEHMDPYHDIQ